MRPLACLALLLASAASSAQWTKVDANYGVADTWATNLVAGDETYVYATVLAGQPTPNRFLILRSADDGDTWTEVFSGYNGGARGYGLRQLDGQWGVLIRGNGETALLLSNDGATWTETAALIPVATSVSVARIGTTYVVTGSNPSYRSTDGGATWTTFGQDQPMGGVRAFNGAFYALSGIGQLFRLDGDTWTQINFGSAFATDLFVEGGRLWAKASANTLYASSDGTTWAAQTTDRPTEWGLALTTPADATPWFLPGAQTVFLSTDNGATAQDITTGYPDAGNGFLCSGNHGASATAAFANLLCSFTNTSQNGLYRYRFSAHTASESTPEASALAIQLANPTRSGAPVVLHQLEPGPLTVTLVDPLGRLVAVLVQEGHRAAETTVPLPRGLAPGVYTIRAASDERVVLRTLTVVR